MAFSGSYGGVVEAQADGLLHYWSMDEASGLTFADAVGDLPLRGVDSPSDTQGVMAGVFENARNFRYNANPAVAGLAGAYVWESGVNDYTNPLPQYTISMWYRPISLQPSFVNMYLFAAARASASIQEFNFQHWNNGGVAILYRLDGSNVSWASSPTAYFVAEQWAHVCVTCDGSFIRMRINNTEVYSAAINSTHALHLRSGRTAIGARPGTALNSFESQAIGGIDDVAIWSRALSEVELGAIYAAGAGVPIIGEPQPGSFAIGATLPEPQPQLRWWHDWTAELDPITTLVYYRAVLTGAADGLDDLPLAIGSWQATAQDGRADYLQIVVPGASDALLAEVEARAGGEVVVYRGARFADGTSRDLEIVRVPYGRYTFDRGPYRATMTLSGYGAPAVAAQDGQSRDLAGVRSVSVSTSGMRVRSSIDWLLRPGMVVRAAGRQFVAAYINYYVTPGGEFMDVGERAE